MNNLKKFSFLFISLLFFSSTLFCFLGFGKKTDSFPVISKLPVELKGQVFKLHEQNLFNELEALQGKNKLKKLKEIIILANDLLNGRPEHIKWARVLINHIVDCIVNLWTLEKGFICSIDVLNIILEVILSESKEKKIKPEYKYNCGNNFNCRCLLCHLLDEYKRRQWVTSVNSFLVYHGYFTNLLGSGWLNKKSNSEKVKLLVSHFSDRADVGLFLNCAVEEGCYWLVHILLQMGVNPNFRDFDCRYHIYYYHRNDSRHHSYYRKGTAPLHRAAHWGRVDIAKLLLQYGADINIRDEVSFTPLSRALISDENKKSNKMAYFLIKNGADVNIQDDCDGFSPLHRTVLCEDFDLTLALLSVGAKMDLVAKNGYTVYQSIGNTILEALSLLLTSYKELQEKGDNSKFKAYLVRKKAKMSYNCEKFKAGMLNNYEKIKEEVFNCMGRLV